MIVQLDDERERDWLAACRHGDSAACARVVHAYQDLALRTAFLLTNDRQAAEDVAQNAFLNAFRHLDRFDLDRPFRPWFLAILANEARMFLRSQRGRRQVPLDEASVDIRVEQADALLSRVIRDDERARVRAALGTLDEPFRTTIVLYYFNDLSIDEVAAATDTSPGTVKSRLYRGRQELRQALSGAEEPPPAPARQLSWRTSR
jgi:RNA polymerase sigma-70 factor (ECF subfamily)